MPERTSTTGIGSTSTSTTGPTGSPAHRSPNVLPAPADSPVAASPVHRGPTNRTARSSGPLVASQRHLTPAMPVCAPVWALARRPPQPGARLDHGLRGSGSTSTVGPAWGRGRRVDRRPPCSPPASTPPASTHRPSVLDLDLDRSCRWSPREAPQRPPTAPTGTKAYPSAAARRQPTAAVPASGCPTGSGARPVRVRTASRHRSMS